MLIANQSDLILGGVMAIVGFIGLIGSKSEKVRIGSIVLVVLGIYAILVGLGLAVWPSMPSFHPGNSTSTTPTNSTSTT